MQLHLLFFDLQPLGQYYIYQAEKYGKDLNHQLDDLNHQLKRSMARLSSLGF